MSSFLFCLLICISMHACNARFLGFNNMDVHEMNLHETSTPSGLTPSTVKEFGDQELESSHGASTRNMLVNLLALLKKKQGMRKRYSELLEPSGNEVIVSSKEDLQHTARIKGWRRQQRFMIGLASSDTEEAVESNENDIVEDVVVMDYAQPHRKPPIHNEKP